MAVENPNSCDFRAALEVEREKTAEVTRDLEVSKGEVKRLMDEVSKVMHHRTGLLADRDRLNNEVNDMKQQYNELVEHLRAEKKRLRGRRDEFGSYCRSWGLAKMAHLVQKRLTRIKANIDDNKAIEPKFLEYNQVQGNIRMLEELVKTNEIEIKSPGLMQKLGDDLKLLGDEVDAHEITDIQDGDFDAYTLFEHPSEVPRFSAFVPTLGDWEEGDDEPGEKRFPPVELVGQSQGVPPGGSNEDEVVDQPEAAVTEATQTEVVRTDG